MHEPDRALELSDKALREAGVANKTVAVLARAVAGIQFSESDQGTLGQANNFLNDVKKGFNWIENPEVTSDSVACAFSFSTAASSWERGGTDPNLFIKDIEKMIVTIHLLSVGSPADANDLNETRVFFNRVFRHYMSQVSSIGSRPDIPELR